MILEHMDYIFLECLLVLKVKGGGSRETVDCLGHLEIPLVGELWGGERTAPFLGRVTLGSAQRKTVPSKPEVIYDLGFL